MRLTTCVLILVVVAGCSLGNTGIRRGTPITHIQANFGEPDVVSDSSGDLTRFYVPTNRPMEEWPSDAPRTFYYLERNLSVSFERRKAARAEAIDPATRRVTLEPLVQNKKGSGSQEPILIHGVLAGKTGAVGSGKIWRPKRSSAARWRMASCRSAP